MIGCINGELGNGREGVGLNARCQLLTSAFGIPQQIGMTDLGRGIGAQPIVGIVAIHEMLDVRFRPARQRCDQRVLCFLNALALRRAGMAARH